MDGFGDDSVTVLGYDTCDGVAFAKNVVSAVPDLDNEVMDGIYAEVPVLVNINTADIENISSSYPGYFTVEDERVFLRFCVKSELGKTTIYNVTSGINENTPISYSKVKVEVEIDMSKGFKTTSVAVEEEIPEEVATDTEIEYERKFTSKVLVFIICCYCLFTPKLTQLNSWSDLSQFLVADCLFSWGM